MDALGVIPSSAPATQLMEILKGAVGRQVSTGKTNKYRKDKQVQERKASTGKTSKHMKDRQVQARQETRKKTSKYKEYKLQRQGQSSDN